MHSYEEPVYLISVVASILCVHPQTLRQYEREGIIRPSRTEGRMRLYSQQDIDQIKLVLKLTKEIGVNLAGVDIIMRLRQDINRLEDEVDRLRDALHNANPNGSVPRGKQIVASQKSEKSGYIIVVDEV
jgi:MerR family transcriptional regulator/heat shock protein HspR